MEVSICKHCKKVYTSKFKEYTCRECIEKDNDLFDRVEEYLKKYPHSSALQIAEGLEVDAYEILKFIDEGRLEMTSGTFERIDS